MSQAAARNLAAAIMDASIDALTLVSSDHAEAVYAFIGKRNPPCAGR